ncbi:hypothetical protein MGYG_04426 [Nannizzia gypsea CBS 118893]|uniref:Uncharacterized protein n=1 Tax=Arthroderma gypseum (strain ATCC MYA-4604 / CBS 118893) TaxID=535722 RepID=E4USX1_ARTGP|nr:hypothetical protein MGYG_04426 [Nannizzia gypsea CBS 118893]EFR01420.1 hypothetical protein MGYG_04426 [Nannizzia gypsea CBS 118893]
MGFTDLPPELCIEIFNEVVIALRHEAIKARLVCKFFYHGINQAFLTPRVLRILISSRKLGWPPAIAMNNYLGLRILKEGEHSNIVVRTIRKSVEALLLSENTTSHKTKVLKTVTLTTAACYVTRPNWIVSVQTPTIPNEWKLDTIQTEEIPTAWRLKTIQTPDLPIHLLSAAAYDGSIQLATDLLRQGVSCNQTSDVFGPPLCMAAYRGNKAMVNLLLSFNANPEFGYKPRGYKARKKSNPRTPLQAATFGGHAEIVDLLLQPEIGVSRSGSRYYKAMAIAAKLGYIDIFKRLMNAGNVQDNPLFQWEECLINACWSGSLDMVRIVLDRSGKLECMEPGETSLLAVVRKRYRESPLIVAADKGYDSIVRLLLERGTDPNPMDYFHTALTAAANHGHLEIVRVLLEHGADVHTQHGSVRYAARGGHGDIIQLLLENGAQISGWERNKNGVTGHQLGQWAYREASAWGHKSLASRLLELGVKMDDIDI